MATRTTRKTITFTKPFVLGDFDEMLPAGDYVVDMDEDLLHGLSFYAYIRVLTIIHLPHKSGNPLLSRALTVDPRELDAAQMRDRGSPELLAWSGESGRDLPLSHDGQRPSAERLALEVAENEGMMDHVH